MCGQKLKWKSIRSHFNLMCQLMKCVFAKDASMKFWESDWICVFFEHEKFSYVIGLAFVRDVVSLFHSLESQCQSRMKERAVNLTCLWYVEKFTHDASMFSLWNSVNLFGFVCSLNISYIIGLAFVRAVVSLLHSLGSQWQSEMREVEQWTL